MMVMPMPMRAVGATEASSGWMDPAVMNAGVRMARMIHKTAMTPMRTIS